MGADEPTTKCHIMRLSSPMNPLSPRFAPPDRPVVPRKEPLPSDEEMVHYREMASSMANAARVSTSDKFPHTTVRVAEAVHEAGPLNLSALKRLQLEAHEAPAAGQRSPRRGFPELMSLKESVYGISG